AIVLTHPDEPRNGRVIYASPSASTRPAAPAAWDRSLRQHRVRLPREDGPPPTLLLLVPDPPTTTGLGLRHKPLAVIHSASLKARIDTRHQSPSALRDSQRASASRVVGRDGRDRGGVCLQDR